MERLRDEIAASADGRITFARFMERALTEPGLGYYATSATRPTREGDFLTAPELHPLFARCVGRALLGVWERLGRPAPFRSKSTVRVGGPSATGCSRRSRTRRPTSAERSDGMRSTSIRRADTRADDAIVGVVLANEYLDALPVHRVVGSADGLRELHVTWRDGWFAFEEGPLSAPDLARHLADVGVALEPLAIADVCLAAPAWVAGVAGRLDRGVVLVIDYGHPAAELYGPRRPAGTLLAYRGHRVSDDVLDAVGRQDLTAHVDLTALESAAARSGLRAVGSTTQARFLVALGLGGMLAELGRQPGMDAATYAEARASVARLLDPRHLGSFRVLAWGRGVAGDEPLPGFDA